MKDKEIAILTLYYKNYNYGGQLQAYALQKKLEKLGYNSAQICYKLETGYKNKKNIKRILKIILYPLVKIRYLLKNYRWIKNRSGIDKKISTFSQNIPHTKIYTAKNIKKLNDEFDTFICGSDQIWNPIGWQDILMLSFVEKNKHKISYAASIAKNKLNNDELKFLCNNIQDFDYISIREPNNKEEIEKIINKEVFVMPDPTLLLNKEEWKEKVGKRMINEKYVLVYLLGENIEYRKQITKYCNKINKKVIFIPFVNRNVLEWDIKNNKLKENIGVENFLSLIYYADLVITDSFHGLVFSLIFQKEFAVLDRFKQNDSKSMNSRLDNLLNEVNMKEKKCSYIDENYTYKALDEKQKKNIKEELDKLSKQGTNFLEKALKTK